ncbi:glycosylphosphatidylinositol anchor attachment 1 protein-like isoform X2 [Artemia franciscana]|uniref:GPI-anchor transamidase component GPAA1 n=2 Tax=Artemia franciscana TaxID=6661 RepID=A0AA88IEX7_ARTSF|nr:hypothetical protein QYM36_000091 [Artemia franciscana]
MGVLSNRTSGKFSLLDPLVKIVITWNRNVCYFCYIFGILGFVSLAYESVSSGVYISENALLPGLVHGQFNSESVAREFLTSIQEEASRYPNGMPYAWIAAQFQQLGLDVGTQDFVLRYNIGPKTNYTGRNVYGILRARRHSSRESVVLAAPYRPPNSVFTPTNGGIALMLAFAKAFRSASYWAKDIIFLVTEHEHLGMEAWLEAYHRVSPAAGLVDSGDLKERAGSIQAAINLEIPEGRASYIDVKIEGLNGQLPNLDLVNLAHRLCRRERVQSTFKKRVDPYDGTSLEGFLENLETMLSMMSSQATGVPTGNHGFFHRFGIEAITLAGYYEPGMHHPIRYHELGRIVEGIFRSLNNLQERFHQSFFFYLLSGTNRYISIGVYMIPFSIMAAPLLLRAVSIWFDLVQSHNAQKDLTSLNYDQVCGIIILCHVFGSCLFLLPSTAAKLGLSYFEFETDESVYYGFILASVIIAMLLMFPVKRIDARAIRCIAHLEMATLMFATALQNISLATFQAFIVTPLFLGTGTASSRKGVFFKRLIVLLAHPVMILHVVLLLDAYRTFPEETPPSILLKSLSAAKRSVMYSLMDSFVYGNKMYDTCIQFYLPIWMLHWLTAGQ